MTDTGPLVNAHHDVCHTLMWRDAMVVDPVRPLAGLAAERAAIEEAYGAGSLGQYMRARHDAFDHSRDAPFPAPRGRMPGSFGSARR